MVVDKQQLPFDCCRLCEREFKRITAIFSYQEHTCMPAFQPVRGMRDLTGEEAQTFTYIIAKARQTSALYGYREVITPHVEPLELLAAKSGEEIRQRMFIFKDLGERQVALRPEFTASIARLATRLSSPTPAMPAGDWTPPTTCACCRATPTSSRWAASAPRIRPGPISCLATARCACCTRKSTCKSTSSLAIGTTASCSRCRPRMDARNPKHEVRNEY